MKLRTRIWLGVLLAPSAWIAMEGAGYYLASRACDASGGVHALGPVHPRALTLLLAVVCIGVAAAGLMIALRNVHDVARESPQASSLSFLARGGSLASGVFLTGIVMFGLPALFVDACSQARW